MFTLKKNHCVDCHFLSTWDKHPGEISTDLREKIKQGTWEDLNRRWVVNCQRGIWDAGYGQLPKDKQTFLVKKDRDDKCFWRYRPRMLFPTALEMSEREHEANRSRHALWIAVVAIFTSAAVGAFSIFFQWYFEWRI